MYAHMHAQMRTRLHPHTLTPTHPHTHTHANTQERRKWTDLKLSIIWWGCSILLVALAVILNQVFLLTLLVKSAIFSLDVLSYWTKNRVTVFTFFDAHSNQKQICKTVWMRSRLLQTLIYDPSWVWWCNRICFNLFSASVVNEMRLRNMEYCRHLIMTCK